jgi:hypothetical protein
MNKGTEGKVTGEVATSRVTAQHQRFVIKERSGIRILIPLAWETWGRGDWVGDWGRRNDSTVEWHRF